MDVSTAEYWLSWIHRGSSIALLLVAVGVGYEFIADRLAKPLNRIVEDARQKELTRLTNETAKLGNETAKLNIDLAQAQKTLVEARERERRLRAEIEKRRSQGEHEAIVAKLKTLPPVDVGVIMWANPREDWDARLFCDEIGFAFRDAGWPHVAWVFHTTDADDSLPGVNVEADDNAVRDAATQIADMFGVLGILSQPALSGGSPMEFQGDRTAFTAPLRIHIGARPRGY